MLARTLAKKQGVTFEKGAAENLAEFVNGDLMRLKTEVDKLATFAAERKVVRREDVRLLVSSEKTTTIWEVADLLVATNLAKHWSLLTGCCVRVKSRCHGGRHGLDVPEIGRGERSAAGPLMVGRPPRRWPCGRNRRSWPFVARKGFRVSDCWMVRGATGRRQPVEGRGQRRASDDGVFGVAIEWRSAARPDEWCGERGTKSGQHVAMPARNLSRWNVTSRLSL